MSSDHLSLGFDGGIIAVGEGLVELAPDGDRLRIGFGGDAANVCVMAARLGARATMLGRVGDDWFGRQLLGFWDTCGVSLDGATVDPAATGVYLNESRPDGGHAFSYWRNGSAGSRLGPEDVNDALLVSHSHLVLTGITLAISDTARRAAERAATVGERAGLRLAFVLNHREALGPDPEVLRRLAARSTIVIGSREDARALFGTDDPIAVAKRLPECRELVLSDGEQPACVVVDGIVHAQPAPAARVRNAAGAGDALAGAYLGGRLAGREPTSSLALGVAASALSVTRDGCARSYPTDAEVAEQLGKLPSAAPTLQDPNR